MIKVDTWALIGKLIVVVSCCVIGVVLCHEIYTLDKAVKLAARPHVCAQVSEGLAMCVPVPENMSPRQLLEGPAH
jgi:hypothetical protein